MVQLECEFLNIAIAKNEPQEKNYFHSDYHPHGYLLFRNWLAVREGDTKHLIYWYDNS